MQNNEGITYRALAREEINQIFEIDRSEIIEEVYYLHKGQLVLKQEHREISDWDYKESRIPDQMEMYDVGGFIYGAFDGARLAGFGTISSDLIGEGKDTIRLASMYVGCGYRKRGIATAIFNVLKEKAADFGGKKMYVTSDTSRNAVLFYMSVGFKVSAEPIPEAFEEEPEDIHMEMELG